jgi:hypothetical protein
MGIAIRNNKKDKVAKERLRILSLFKVVNKKGNWL